MRTLALVLLATVFSTAGCDARPQTAGSTESPPVGRYQFIGKEKYEDGTVEYACLDTATGSISYATIYPLADKERASLTNFDCSK